MALTRDFARCGVIILAAGQGKRMCSPLPKVLQEIAGKPLIFHVLEQVKKVAPEAPIAIVVGYGREEVERYLNSEPNFQNLNISFVVQPQQWGTGHAARCAVDSEWGARLVKSRTPILILPGDLPLISSDLVEKMIHPLKKAEALRLLTCELDNPTGYGRIVRRGTKGPILKIVEEKDASSKEKAIREVATSIYLFRSEFLKDSLQSLSNFNAQREYYLTDLVEIARKKKKAVAPFIWSNSVDVQGVNDPWELSLANRAMNSRKVCYWAKRGVKFLDYSNVHLDANVTLETGSIIHPYVILRGNTSVGENSVIEPAAVLRNVKVGKNVRIKVGTVAEDSEIGSDSSIGPYAHLRPQSRIASRVKIGNFVELKKTSVDERSSIAHLSYLGDARVGRDVNIGCGFVTCNFDGRTIHGKRKHETVIEDEAFIGSDCQTVAPVRVGKRAYVASGSTVTEDVPDESLAIARSRQVTKQGYARKFRSAKEE